MIINATSVHSSAPPIEENLEKKKYPHAGLHRLFLVATAGLSIASVIPGARQVSSLALRSVAFFSSSAICADGWDQLDRIDRFLSVAKIGVVALGFVGVVLSKPVVFVAALASEVGLQVLEIGKALYERDLEKGLTHLGILAIDSFMLAGVVTGSWPLITTAAALSAAAMTGFFLKALAEGEKNNDPWRSFDGVCYAILGATSLVSSIQVSKRVIEGNERAPFRFTNNKDTDVSIYDKKGHLLGTLKPGESGVFETRIYRCGEREVLIRTVDANGVQDGSRVKIHDQDVYLPKKTIPPMKPHKFPTLPLGGTLVVEPNGISR